MKASHTIRPVFDDPNLVSVGGLVPVMRLGEAAGLNDLLEEVLSVDSPNRGLKATNVIGAMLAGADCIDDLDLLRHGGMDRIFGGLRAPLTWGPTCGRSPTATSSSSTRSQPRCWRV